MKHDLVRSAVALCLGDSCRRRDRRRRQNRQAAERHRATRHDPRAAREHAAVANGVHVEGSTSNAWAKSDFAEEVGAESAAHQADESVAATTTAMVFRFAASATPIASTE